MHIFYIYFLLNQLVLVYTTANVTVLRSTRNVQKSIIDENKCKAVKAICDKFISDYDDLSVLECLLSSYPKRLSDLNEDCEQIIWQHTSALIQDERVRETLLPTCRSDLDKFKMCKIDKGSNYLKCILFNLNDIRDDALNADCKQMILRLENVAFTDFQWISGFIQHCTDDIKTLQCGKLDLQSHSQINTISCLQRNILNVQDDCKKEVFRLTEMQSDNIKLDAQLYLDCAEDHARYCSQFFPGSGRVFSCLLHQMHKDQNKLGTKCKEHLQRRQQLIAQDVRISKGLLKACKDDIKKTHCRKQISSDKTVRLAQILLCLENTMKNGTKIDADCEAELIDHRRMLMEDFRLSPEIVNSCSSEIAHYCKGFEFGGKTIHCLMNHALVKAEISKSRIQDKCIRALEDLVRESDAGENWSVDPVLHQACDPVVKVACKGISGGDARIMSCLMDKLGTDYMNEECESALIQIQYFVARDFKLDPQLYRECKKDAVKHCHVNEDNEVEGPSYSQEVLPCLYRYAYIPQEDMKLERTCLQQIRRVMRQRAVSVDLQPEIEEACLKDLALLCHDKIKKGEEMQCLQDKLEEIEEGCRNAVESFTEIEAQHADLNPYISKYCGRIIENLCKLEINNDEGNVMDCLIENKNNPVIKSNHACRASIDHFQIISVKDYRFTYKFKVACKSHAMRLCSHARSKNEVVACLSEQMLNATVHGVKSTIPKDCKQQLRAQIFQQRENIDYDPALKAACMPDIKKYCSNLEPGNSQVLECLQSVPRGKLTKKCDKEVFKVQKLEIYDNTVDYALVTMCAEAIDQFCPHHERETILDCLKMNKDEKGFNKKCRMIIMHRMVEQNANYLLNPSLQENCHLDINKFCKDELSMPEGKLSISDAVIKCLKTQFKSAHLSSTCEKEMTEILREQALNVELNPLIKALCKFEIETICKFEEEDSGKVEECLKTSLLKNRIQTRECKVEVANMIEESQVDIHVDPLLQRACALDLLTFCANIVQGNGRHIQCLKVVMESQSQNLTPNCRNKLRERFAMYESAKLDGLQDLYQHLTLSPSKNYFVIVLFLFVGGIFVIGVLCGQVTKNKYRLLKNK